MKGFIVSLVLGAAVVAGIAYGISSHAKRDLLLALASRDADRVRQVVEKNPGARDSYLSDGWTALAFSAREGDIETVRVLIESGADVDKLEAGGNSPLFWAVYYNHEDVVAELLSNGAEIHNKCRECRDPVSVAMEKNHAAIVRMMAAGDEGGVE